MRGCHHLDRSHLAGEKLICGGAFQLNPPELKETPEAPRQAQEDLAKMGPMTRDEKLMLGTMGGAVVLWVLGDVVGVSSVVTAMLGLSWLLLTGVLQWRDCLTYSPAWDTLFWFAVLVGMSTQLNNAGVIKVCAAFASAVMPGLQARICE